MNTDILDFGAVGDGVTMNTEFIQKAIDECHLSGGGRVNVPAGRYLTGTLRIKSNVELHLEHNAVLKASSNLADYNETDEFPQNCDCPQEKWCGKHLIICVCQENVAITGNGTVEGCAESIYGGPLQRDHNFWWKYGFYEIEDGAPLRPGQLVFFAECKNVECRDITLAKATCWTLFLYGCDFVRVAGIKIFNGFQHANSDGIDIDACSFVTVSDCILFTGDDSLTLRCNSKRLINKEKECSHITVSNCVMSSSCCAVRIGVGNGKIHHANLSNIVIKRASVGFCFTTNLGGDCLISDINISNITGDNVAYPIDMFSRGVPIERIVFENYRTKCKANMTVVASKKGEISDITLHNMSVYEADPEIDMPELKARDMGTHLFSATNVDRLCFDNVKIYARDNGLEDREGFIQIKNSAVTKDDLTLAYKGEEKMVISE